MSDKEVGKVESLGKGFERVGHERDDIGFGQIDTRWDERLSGHTDAVAAERFRSQVAKSEQPPKRDPDPRRATGPFQHLDETWAEREGKFVAGLQAQVDKLAWVIVNEIEGEPSESEGAVDCAIRLLRDREKMRKLVQEVSQGWVEHTRVGYEQRNDVGLTDEGYASFVKLLSDVVLLRSGVRARAVGVDGVASDEAVAEVTVKDPDERELARWRTSESGEHTNVDPIEPHEVSGSGYARVDVTAPPVAQSVRGADSFAGEDWTRPDEPLTAPREPYWQGVARRVSELHQPILSEVCKACDQDYPCPTQKILHGEDWE